MILNPNQIEELLNIIDKNHLVFIGHNLGLEYLSDVEKQILEDSGVNLKTLYDLKNDAILTSFHLGLLSDALKDNLNTTSYTDLQNYVNRGHYIPLTIKELASLDYVKAQTLKDVKTLRGNIFNDINQVVVNQSQQEFLKDEIHEGLKNKKTVKQIASDIGHKTGDWIRNFDRIVEYNCQSAYEAGKAEYIKATYGEDSYVYKSVFSQACKHCVRLYLTKGVGSEPRIFKLSELQANGTNIGRKTADYKVTIGPIHPYCRCILHYKDKGMNWDQKTKSFSIVAESKRIRPKVELTIGDKKYMV